MEAQLQWNSVRLASVVVYQRRQVYSSRLMRAYLVDLRQQGLRDGCAENVTVLSTVLKDAKVNFKQAHVASFDVDKAF